MLQSSMNFTFLNNLVSSANIFILQFTISGMSMREVAKSLREVTLREVVHGPEAEISLTGTTSSGKS